SQSSRTNYLVTLEGVTRAGVDVQGIGEGQPRGARTGDDAGDSWKFLEDAGSRLANRELTLSSAADALTAVRGLMAEFVALADEYAHGPEYRRPFRGTLLGIETAVLDLAATALGLPLSRLLGEVRQAALHTAASVSDRRGVAALQRSLAKQADAHPRVRLAGYSDATADLALLELAATLGR